MTSLGTYIVSARISASITQQHLELPQHLEPPTQQQYSNAMEKYNIVLRVGGY